MKMCSTPKWETPEQFATDLMKQMEAKYASPLTESEKASIKAVVSASGSLENLQELIERLSWWVNG